MSLKIHRLWKFDSCRGYYSTNLTGSKKTESLVIRIKIDVCHCWVLFTYFV